jgi:hypothetical protein
MKCFLTFPYGITIVYISMKYFLTFSYGILKPHVFFLISPGLIQVNLYDPGPDLLVGLTPGPSLINML